MSAQLTKIKGSDAGAILLWTAGKEAAIAVKSARDLGIELPLFGGSGQARLEFAEGAGPASDGFTFGTGKSLVPSNWGEETEGFKVVSDFAGRYEAAYGEVPTSSQVMRSTPWRSSSMRWVEPARMETVQPCETRSSRRWSRGLRRAVHVLADGSQRPDCRRSCDVSVRGRRMGYGPVVDRVPPVAEEWA